MRSDPSTDWMRLWRTAPGRPVGEVEGELRELIARHGVRGIDDFMVESTARAMVDRRWAIHHPVRALAFAWRFRKRKGFISALQAVFRPRFGG